MKNKGMHQQPNAFSPSTGAGAPQNKNFHKSDSHGSANPPPSWSKPQTSPSHSSGGGKGSEKSHKK
jgi:hypothetical protein